jgi:hypothetical protein
MKNTLLINIYFILFSFTYAKAQHATIRGKVMDQTGMELIGANVLIADSSTGTVTDIDGSYSLKVQPGNYTLVVSYLGYDEYKIADVAARENEVTLMDDVLLGESAVMAETVVVTGKKINNSLAAVQALQRNSIRTLDAVSSQTFSARGDGDVAAAVKAVPGISVESGKYVFIRGLGDRYVKTMLNNASIPGLDPNRNTVQMDLFPTSIIDNVQIYKNFMPDLPGDFTGGVINVVTKDFPDDKTLNIGLSLGYNPNVNFNNNYLSYKGSSTDFLGFDNGARNLPSIFNQGVPTRGAVLSSNAAAALVREQTLALSHNLAPVAASNLLNHGLTATYGDQKTLAGKSIGFITGLTYKRDFGGYANGQTERWQYVSTNLQRQRGLTDSRFSDMAIWSAMLGASIKLNALNKLGINVLHTQSGEKVARYQEGHVDAEGFDYQERTLKFSERALSTLQLKGEHSFSNKRELKIDWVSSASRATMDQPDLRFFNNTINNGTPMIDAAADILPTRFFRNMQEWDINNSVDASVQFNQWSGLKSRLKFGAAYLLKNRSYREALFVYDTQSDWYDGDPNTYVNENSVFSTENPNGILIENRSEGSNQYDAQLHVPAAYAMVELPLNNKLTMVAGLRGEYTYMPFTSYDISNSGNSTVFNLYGTDFKYDSELNNFALLSDLDIMPSMVLKMELMDKMNLRLNYSRTVARPTFREKAPTKMFDVELGYTILGKTDLQITTIDNADIRWEYFFSRGEMASVSLFYKNFKNPIELTISPQADRELRYDNVPSAQVYGAEAEVRKNMAFAGMEYLNMGFNFSYIYSQVDIPADELAAKRANDPGYPSTRPMYIQSPYMANAYLEYDNEKMGTQANLSFNVQGERLKIVSRGLTPDVYEQPFPTLNLKVSQKIKERFTASVKASNLLNSTYKEVYDVESAPVFQLNRPGTSVSVGISLSL